MKGFRKKMTVSQNQLLWRYFKPLRFCEVLDQSNFYFAAATEFSDIFEGAVAIMPPDFPIDPRYSEAELDEQAFAELKRLTKINCWHFADHESSAMWNIYANVGKGVAVCSTPNRIKKAFKEFRLAPKFAAEPMRMGPVRYVDLLQERLEAPDLERFFFKHHTFSYENEFRLIISLRIAEEFGCNIPEKGIKVDVDLNILIEKIVLGPSLTPDEKETIIKYVNKRGLGAKVYLSSLLGKPRYI